MLLFHILLFMVHYNNRVQLPRNNCAKRPFLQNILTKQKKYDILNVRSRTTPWDNYVFWRKFELKREYITPEYENKNQLEDVILVSVVVNEDEGTINGIIDIKDLFNFDSK